MAVIPAVTQRFKSLSVLAKLEATAETDAAPTGAADAARLIDATLSIMCDEKELPYVKDTMGANPSVLLNKHSKLTAKLPLVGSGAAGTAPRWGIWLEAAGAAKAVDGTAHTVTYSPLSNRSGQKSLTIYFARGGARHKIVGARGTCKFSLSTSDYPAIEIEFLGRYAAAEAADQPVCDWSGWPDPLEVSTVNTPIVQLNGHDLVLESAALDLGVKAEFIARAGRSGVRLSDRASTAQLTIEAPALAEFNIEALAEARTGASLVLQHGVGAGQKIHFAAPAWQLAFPTDKESSGDYMLDLSGKLLPVTGDDEWSIVCS